MAGTAGLLLVSSLILFLGIVSKVIADRYEIPSVVFLLLFGITLGPEGVGVIDPEIFGEAGRSIIVSLSVAVIVFEGGFHLTLSKIRKAPGSTLRLVTVGALITLVGGGVATKYLVDLPWDVSFLISSLLVATGPTVITPVLSHVNVREGVRGILESEGIINDVSAAILAIVMFEVVVVGDSAGGSLVTEFVSRLGTGVVVGALAAGVTWYVLSIRDVARSSQNARLIVLGTAVLSFAVSETVATESGVAAVAVAGMLLGNADVPNKDEIAKFKGDITVIVLSVVFILLASLLKVGFILHLGLGGVLLVALLVLVVRPLAVMLSTVRSRFTLRERLFISGVGPRGIIPASIATFFAVELRNQPGIAPSTANAVVSVVFLVILVTVVFQAGGAPFLARKLNIIPMNIVVVGGGRVGREIARSLESRGESVVVIEKDEEAAAELRDEGFSVVEGNGTDSEVLREAGIERAKYFVAVTGDDDQNILACQTVMTKFGVDDVIGRVNNSDNRESFEDLGVKTVSPTRSTSFVVDSMIERPGLFSWLSELGEGGDVVEIDLGSSRVAGCEVGEVDLPEGCIIALIRRDGDQFVPEPGVELRKGDHLTLIGRAESVREAVEKLK